MGGDSGSSSATMAIDESSRTQTTQTLQGSTASQSPTIWSNGPVTFDAGKDVSLTALEDMTKIVQNALTQAGSFASGIAGNQADATAAQAVNDTNLLQSVLAANSQLSQNSQTGGATAAITQTNYIIWGLIGLAAVGLAVFFFRK